MDMKLKLVAAAHEASDADTKPGPINIGLRLHRLRKERKWSLVQTSERTGLSLSALSKIERGELSPTLSSLGKIAAGFEMDVVSLLSDTGTPVPQGRRSVNTASNGLEISTKTCMNMWFAADLSNKRMLPVKTTITARSVREYSEWPVHSGEIFVYVLSGEITIHTQFYAPTVLGAGETIYYDASIGHKWISTSPDDAEVLWIYAE